MTTLEEEFISTPDNTSEQTQDTFHTRQVATLGFAHGAHDMFFSFIPPIQPLLMEKLVLSHAQVGLFSLFLQVPSVLQPFIGHLADRRNLKLIIILAPLLSAVMISLIGLAPNYGTVVLLMLIAGFSTAGFHAIAPVLVAARSGRKMGRGMGLFMVGGELGYAIGPVLVVAVVGALTLAGMPWLISIGVLCSLILYFSFRDLSTIKPQSLESPAALSDVLLSMRSIFLPIIAFTFITAFLYANIVNFLPTFLKAEGASFAFSGMAFSIVEISGTVGLLFSGWISDRIGQRKVIFISTITMLVFSLLFLNVKGWLQVPMLIGLGLLAFSANPAFLSIIQHHFVDNRSLANGLYMASSFIIRSLVVFVVGLLADQFGLRVIFTCSTWGAFLAIPLIFLLPKK